ncbi:hypothetical protein TSAR_009904 [Trichomalopsis sarcophagae]|uniref:PWWP domain-containing protein n=1 Tax=Trichomalopsis sarcophagae TaxID=543379 RepID=A0A232FLQ7_9HYME|nr:hypothetical protein TSAR_009904 [Trichomalopsis sarcophagae]
MHSTLHEDQDGHVRAEPQDDPASAKATRMFAVGEVVWGCARGNAAWPGKVEAIGALPTSLSSSPGGTNAAAAATAGPTVWIRWYGSQRETGLSQVAVKSLKSLSEGLEAHHRARKKFRKSRKLNTQLENAIQEAMAELDNKPKLQSQPDNSISKPKPREKLIAPATLVVPAPQQQQQQRTIGLRKTPGRKVPQVALAVAVAPRKQES